MNEKIKICREVYLPFLRKVCKYIYETKYCINVELQKTLTNAHRDFLLSYNPNYESNLTVCRNGIKDYLDGNYVDKQWYVQHTSVCLQLKVDSDDQLAFDIFGYLDTFCRHKGIILKNMK